jgi:hypothetical protein
MEENILTLGLPLVVAFAGLGDEFSFRKTLADLKVNTIFIRDLYHQWYLGSLGELGSGITQTSSSLHQLIKDAKPSSVLFLGASAGGFAALLFGSLLVPDAICVFSPQTFRSKWLVLRHWDYRWLDRVADIYSNPIVERKYLDLAKLNFSDRTRISVYFASGHRLDHVHAQRLKNSGCVLMPINSNTHNAADYFRKKDSLKNLIQQAMFVNAESKNI